MPEEKRNVSKFGAFGYIQCLYPKRPSRVCLRTGDLVPWACPIFPTQGNLPASWSLSLSGLELPQLP